MPALDTGAELRGILHYPFEDCTFPIGDGFVLRFGRGLVKHILHLVVDACMMYSTVLSSNAQ